MQTHLGGTRRQQRQEIFAAHQNECSCVRPCVSRREAASGVSDLIDATLSVLIQALPRGKCGAVIAAC